MEFLFRYGCGYSSGKLKDLVSSDQKKELKEVGIFNEKGYETFKNSVVFPLYSSAGKVTGLYGRKLASSAKVKHLYLKETMYFNSMWSVADTCATVGLQQSKSIYVGETRVATKLNYKGSNDFGYENINTYYYHSDHLGSSNVITDNSGDVYEHIEYTPYGEMWVVDQKADNFDNIPYRFTAKEWDEETKLYYMSARYQNPMTSRWMSADPSGASLINPMRRGFNIIESQNWYSYVGNNPIKYFDPTGMKIRDPGDDNEVRMTPLKGNLGDSSAKVSKEGCSLVASARAAYDAAGKDFTGEAVEALAKNSDYFDSEGNLDRNKLWEGVTGKAGDWQKEDDASKIPTLLKDLDKKEEEYTITGRALLKIGGEKAEHEITINGISTNEDGSVSFDWTATSTNDEGREYTSNGTGNIGDLTGLRYQKIEEPE